MGCAKIKRNNFDRNAVVRLKNLFFVYLVASMFVLAFLTSVVFGANEHSTTITVTFTPSGDIELNVTLGHASFGSTPAGVAGNYSPTEGGGSDAYVLYNNGTAGAHVYIHQNGSTDSGAWSAVVAVPGDDEFAIRTVNDTGGAYRYIPAFPTNTSWISNLAAKESHAFGLHLYVGAASVGGILVAQKTRINITGAAA